MSFPVRNIEVGDIERAIRDGFRLLRFSAPLERRFEADAGRARCRSMIRHNCIGLIVYHAFLYNDYYVIGDVFEIDLIAHFAIMTPIVIAVNYLLSRQPAVWVRESLESLTLVAMSLTIALVVSASRLPDRDIAHFTTCLVILFAIIMPRIRFWYLIAACLLISIVYIFSLFLLTPLSMDRALMSISLFLGIVLFSLAGAYNLEHEQRMGYLLRLRDRFRHRALKVITLRDALTGIGNRRALDAALARLSGADAVGRVTTTAVLLMDIDHFKMFNDCNGHQEGDLCLKRVAALVSGGVRRPEGEAYRYGGEEFLVLLDDTSPDAAMNVAERIRSSVASARIPRDPASDAAVTISVGVAFGRLGRDATPDSLVAAADRALYAAKREGRNRVSLAVPHDGTVASVPRGGAQGVVLRRAGPDALVGPAAAARS